MSLTFMSLTPIRATDAARQHSDFKAFGFVWFHFGSDQASTKQERKLGEQCS
jgi:hypothetical protein